jgi:hypothetical protein
MSTLPANGTTIYELFARAMASVAPTLKQSGKMHSERVGATLAIALASLWTSIPSYDTLKTRAISPFLKLFKGFLYGRESTEHSVSQFS